MTDQEIDNLIIEFKESSDSWASLRLSEVVRWSDIQLRNADRDFNLRLNLTSIFAAFLAIVLPLTKSEFPFPFIKDIGISVFITFTMGTISLILAIKRDKNILPQNKKWSLENLSKFQRKALEILDKLREYKKTKKENQEKEILDDVKSYVELRQAMENEVKKIEEKRKKEISYIFSCFIELCFWVFFIISIIILFVGFLTAYK